MSLNCEYFEDVAGCAGSDLCGNEIVLLDDVQPGDEEHTCPDCGAVIIETDTTTD